MTRSRPLALAVIALLAAAPLAAQSRQFAVTPVVGRATTGTLFEHRYSRAFESGGEAWWSYGAQRLQVDPALVAGARLDYGLARRWRLFAEGTFGAGTYDYREARGANPQAGYWTDGPSGRFVVRENDASITTVSIGLEHVVPLAPRLELGLGAAAAARSLVLSRAHAAYEKSYLIPGAAGSLALRMALTDVVGIEARGLLSGGTVDTRGFGEVTSFDIDGVQAPVTPPSKGERWVRSSQVTLGLTVRP